MADVPTKPGFLAYQQKHLPKVNSLRLANSLVQINGVPTPDKGEVLFSPPEASHNEPRSCYNCEFYFSRAKTCHFFGPSVRIEKFIYPPTPQDASKPIEYHPVCGAWNYGRPKEGMASYQELPYNNPDDIGLGWVNAPEVGLKLSGTCCGGANGGDDCDSYQIPGEDKRASKTGFCRVLQLDVPNMACCTEWADDDFVEWQKARDILADLDKRKVSNSSPNPLLPK